MNSRNTRNGPSRSGAALIHRGPQAHSASQSYSTASAMHAPNAALLIDFDNVTMGIRSDLGKELRTLLGSDVIKGKVAVQRAYADWRRYPQYVVPLAESSIDMIWAPAYGSSKKNATDIRLAVDAIELLFTRPEIGTFILLSGDSDFASLVNKLKEYGKYVIGVGIRESSSDLLVMNCDEYYSYNALAGLVKSNDEEPARKWDPWELVTEAVQRMQRNGDVMRSDRLKQVMVEIDNAFDEKDLGMAKFSRFVQDATQRGLISATKLENGQLEIGLPGGAHGDARAVESAAAGDAAHAEGAASPTAAAAEARREGGRSRRGRRGRGRDRDDRPRADGADAALDGEVAVTLPVDSELVAAAAVAPPAPRTPRPERAPRPDRAAVAAPPAGPSEPVEQIGASGERLTRDEAYDLVRRSVAALTNGDETVRAGVVRTKARELLGRDSESLSDRNFPRILKDAHDGDVIDLRRRGDDFEIARASEAESVAEQLAKTAISNAPVVAPATAAPRGMGPRGGGARGGRPGARTGGPPPNLLSFGVVGPSAGSAATAAPAARHAPSAAVAPSVVESSPAPAPGLAAASETAARRGARKTAAKKSATSRKAAARPVSERPVAAPEKSAAARKAPTAKAAARAPRARKTPAHPQA